jgi:hypothetical protein
MSPIRPAHEHRQTRNPSASLRAAQRRGNPEGRAGSRTSQASASFSAKKAAKKLPFTAGVGTTAATPPNKQTFFASFFQKRSSSFTC